MKLITLSEYEKIKKENKEEWLKYCYELCTYCDWDKEKLERFRTLYNYKETEQLVINGKKYAKKYLKLSDKEIQKFREKYRHNSETTKYNKTFNKLITITDEKEIKKLIEESNCNIYELRSNVHSFLRVHKKELNDKELLELERTNLNKLIKYQENKIKENPPKKNNNIELKREQREKELVDEIEILFTKVINNEITERELIRTITLKKYRKYLNILNKYSIAFYNEYIQKLENDNKEKENLKNEFKLIKNQIINNITNGIKENEELRTFDAIDYHNNYKKFTIFLTSFKEYKDLGLTNTEIRIIKDFYEKNILNEELLNEKLLKDFLETKIEFNFKTDKNGYYIPNSGKQISKEEKEIMLEYLTSNNIPITNKTTQALINRYKEDHKSYKTKIKKF